jgi:hypothetical protein
MDDLLAYLGGALAAAIVAFAIATVGFGMDVQTALTPTLVAAIVALLVVFLTD